LKTGTARCIARCNIAGGTTDRGGSRLQKNQEALSKRFLTRHSRRHSRKDAKKHSKTDRKIAAPAKGWWGNQARVLENKSFDGKQPVAESRSTFRRAADRCPAERQTAGMPPKPAALTCLRRERCQPVLRIPA